MEILKFGCDMSLSGAFNSSDPPSLAKVFDRLETTDEVEELLRVIESFGPSASGQPHANPSERTEQ